MEFTVYFIIGFVVLAAAEAWYLRRSGRGYRLNVAISNLSCGIFNVCMAAPGAIAFAFLYTWLRARVGVTHALGWQWWSLILTFVLVDLCYYAYHRSSHRIAFLWGAHIVHHQSDEYNLTVSLRQGTVAIFASMPFNLVPAVLGVPLPVFLIVHGVYQLYQFFVHTAVVTHMGWLENVLATPRLHRLHHARNEAYIDCNYSGFFIFWDKLFGSYRPPSVEPVYGVTEPLSSWSPLWANIGYCSELISKARRRRGWDRLQTLIAAPEWAPPAERRPLKEPYVTYDARPVFGFKILAGATFGASVVFTILLTWPFPAWSVAARLVTAVAAGGSAMLAAHLFDGKERKEAGVRP